MWPRRNHAAQNHAAQNHAAQNHAAQNHALQIIAILLLLLLIVACRDRERSPAPTATAPAATEAAVEVTAEPPIAEETSEPDAEPTPEEEAVAYDNLHVPSPAWEEQIIYFLMIDRFNDGNPDNNDQGFDEYDPADHRKFSGGDLQGIIEQLDYIQELGATAIWITPPVANQWWDPLVNFGGYHGYWAEDFSEVDAHFGDLESYQALSNALHDREMYLIQDIVANHTGNFFTYQNEDGQTVYDPEDPEVGFRLNEESVPVTAPSQPPFDMNDVRNPEHREADIYHWTPSIVDYNDPEEALYYQLSDLDDLNFDNPLVRETLRQSYGKWVSEVGVDAFRVDTVLYSSHDFWHDFFYADDAGAPGIELVAEAAGKEEFFTFGEAFVGSEPFQDDGERRIAEYLGTEEQPEMDAVLNFPMHFTLNRVFAEGQPTSELAYRLELTQDDSLFPEPNLLPNFIDNHDVARFLSRGNLDGLKQATTFLMTAPGIPVIYYGTEQGFTEQRAAMFAGGWGSGGEDHFNRDAEMYRHLQTVTALRKEHPLFSYGELTILYENEVGPGALAFQRSYEGETAIVLFNSADRPVLLTEMETGLPAGTVLTLLFGLDNQEDIAVGPEGRLTMEIAAREAMVLLVSDEMVDVQDVAATVTVETSLEGEAFTEDFLLSGTASEPDTPLRIILNGNLQQALEATTSDDGTWEVTVPISAFAPGERSNTLTVYAPELGAVSPTFSFQTTFEPTGGGTITYDRVGDDVGPSGNYELPTDETFGEQLDILSTRVTAFGANLQVSLTMADVTDVWGPVNGFDHVLFHIFIDVPGQEGVTVLPGINATAPEGFAWDYMAFIEGWNNRLYSSEGASEDEYGTVIVPAPEISVDQESNTITFLFLAEALDNPESLEGARVYITNWDWNGPDAAYRQLQPVASQWVFGGGDWAVDPLILDDTDVIPVSEGERFYQADPAGDASGPLPWITYTVPAESEALVDIREASMVVAEEGLALSLQMADVIHEQPSDAGFDSVVFHIFIDVPAREGTDLLPRLGGNAPEGVAWDYLALVSPTRLALYSTQSATAESYGTESGGPLPEVSGNAETDTIDVFIPAAALGSPESWEGVKVYVTSWLWDEEAGDMLLPLERADDYPVQNAPLILDDVLLGAPAPYVPPTPPEPQVTVTLVAMTPEGTPEDAQLYMTGPFNNWVPNDANYRFTAGGQGVYTLELTLDEGEQLEYRITRGTFANAEVIDPEDRFANRNLQAPAGVAEATEEITIEGWWDQLP